MTCGLNELTWGTSRRTLSRPRGSNGPVWLTWGLNGLNWGQMGQHEAQMDRFKAQMNKQSNFWGPVKNLQYIHGYILDCKMWLNFFLTILHFEEKKRVYLVISLLICQLFHPLVSGSMCKQLLFRSMRNHFHVDW